MISGKYGPAGLGDLVFEDLNANGIQDSGERGLDGVKVTLTGAGHDGLLGTEDDSTTTTFTNHNGNYYFHSLYPGKYKLTFRAPDRYKFTKPNVGSNDAIDSDVNPHTGMTGVLHLQPSKKDYTIDAGLFRHAKIGNFVFNDANANGIQDAGEAGIEGATVKLLNAAGQTLRTKTTNANGMYSFGGLRPGDYKIMFVRPDGFNVSPFEVGDDIAVDSDANPNNGLMSDVVTLRSGQFNRTIDAGFFKPKPQPAKLGDFVFDDANANGIQDTGEAGIEGATVKLQNAAGQTLDTTSTDASGMYMFSDLAPDTQYKVMFVQPDGFDAVSPYRVGSDISTDSNANPNNGLMSDLVTLRAGQFNRTLNAGFYQFAKLGDFVFNDTNANGIQDAGEAGIAGATVKLQNAAGQTLDTTTTDANGMYMFGGLRPGDYKVMFVQPNGFNAVSPFLVGNNSAADSDANPNNGLMSEIVTLDSGEFNTTLDAGFFNDIEASIDIEKFVRVQPPGRGKPGQDLCETLGKVTGLTFAYLPGTSVNTGQKSDKATASGGVDDDNQAFIVVSGKKGKNTLFSGLVDVGDDFTVNAGSKGKFDSETTIQIFDDQGGPLLQTLTYHTSCSQPIQLGDAIGSVTVTGFTGKDGSATLPVAADFVDADQAPGPEALVGSQVEFRYEVTNTGEAALGNVEVTDDRLTNTEFVSGDDNSNSLLDIGERWIYSASETAVEGLRVNKGTAVGTPVDNSGNILGLEDVMDMDLAHYTGTQPPGPQGDLCDVLGKPRALTFVYEPGSDVVTGQKLDKIKLTGRPDDDPDAYIVVSKDGKLDSDKIFFEGNVSAGESFTAATTKDKFGGDISFQIFDQQGGELLQTFEYHTSCSQPIQLGDILGSVELTGYVGEEGAFNPALV